MEPFVVLMLLPVAIGGGAYALFRKTSSASLAATVIAPLVVLLVLEWRDPGGSWNWLATLLVSPLAIAYAVAVVVYCAGRREAHKRS